MDIGEIIISFSANITTETTRNVFTGTAGDDITLTCSVNITNVTQPDDVYFEWLLDSTQYSLPPDVMMLNESMHDSTYSSTLQFYPLSLSHEGMYTCQLWNYETHTANASITVNCKPANLAMLRLLNFSYL